MQPVHQGQVPNPTHPLPPLGQNPAQVAGQNPPIVQMANGQQFLANFVQNVPPAQNPQAAQIQDDWNQSVAQLNDELKQVRDAMADLLTEIRALIQDYNLHTQLTPVSTAVDASLNAVGEAFRSTDMVSQALSVVDTSGWNAQAVQSFNNSMNAFTQKLAQAKLPVSANPPVLVQTAGNQGQQLAQPQPPVQLQQPAQPQPPAQPQQPVQVQPPAQPQPPAQLQQPQLLDLPLLQPGILPLPDPQPHGQPNVAPLQNEQKV